ncbi:unnamed protein product [Caenorhabditis angaria]|uniref:Neurotransmitter-gated ion-channel ligand-binding domain-containing protein n=1 Tax=Caenorhabditis angaria TaxID=860376 RepID=A0A9P1IAT2_9PELO|nr:unnamed protein product [Caenorhabditis angaria]
MKKLFKSYDSRVAPVIDSHFRQSNYFYFYEGDYYDWFIQLIISQLKMIDLDEPQELFTTSVTVQHMWMDLRLMWNESEYDDIHSIYIRQEHIWSPPLDVYSASDVKDHRDQDFRIVRLFNDGLLRTYVTMRLTTNCPLDMTEFPFDIQTCELHFGLSGVDVDNYNMTIVAPSNELEELCGMGNSAWDVINVTCGQMIHYSVRRAKARLAVLRLVLKRNPLFYMYMIILPTFIINLIAIGGVFLKKSSPMERLTIGFTHIMTMTFILGLVSEKIPKTKEIPLLGKYIVLSLCMMLFALVVSSLLKKFCAITVDNRRFGNLGQTMKIIVLFGLQFLNAFSFFYMIYRFLKFELEYGRKGSCHFRDDEKNYTKYSKMYFEYSTEADTELIY